MPEIVLARVKDGPPLTEAQRVAVRSALFGVVDGLGETNKRSWRRFWNRLLKLEPGEVVHLITRQERIGWYHRKHMALENRLFDEQERFDNFERFRDWLKIGAGHVEWAPGPNGGIVPLPKSISYPKMEQGEFENFHAAVVEFLQATPKPARFLWPHTPPEQARQGLAALIAEFETWS